MLVSTMGQVQRYKHSNLNIQCICQAADNLMKFHAGLKPYYINVIDCKKRQWQDMHTISYLTAVCDAEPDRISCIDSVSERAVGIIMQFRHV